jgi:hypothetical protein
MNYHELGLLMSGTTTEHAGRTPAKFRSVIVAVITPTRRLCEYHPRHTESTAYRDTEFEQTPF